MLSTTLVRDPRTGGGRLQHTQPRSKNQSSSANTRRITALDQTLMPTKAVVIKMAMGATMRTGCAKPIPTGWTVGGGVPVPGVVVIVLASHVAVFSA